MSYTFRGFTLPDRLQESIDAYVQTGRPTGGFLEACITNDLRGAFSRGDVESLAALPAIVAYLYNQCPMNCWGYPGVTAAWRKQLEKERELEAEKKQ